MYVNGNPLKNGSDRKYAKVQRKNRNDSTTLLTAKDRPNNRNCIPKRDSSHSHARTHTSYELAPFTRAISHASTRQIVFSEIQFHFDSSTQFSFIHFGISREHKEYIASSFKFRVVEKLWSLLGTSHNFRAICVLVLPTKQAEYKKKMVWKSTLDCIDVVVMVLYGVFVFKTVLPQHQKIWSTLSESMCMCTIERVWEKKDGKYHFSSATAQKKIKLNKHSSDLAVCARV